METGIVIRVNLKSLVFNLRTFTPFEVTTEPVIFDCCFSFDTRQVFLCPVFEGGLATVTVSVSFHD